MSRGRLLIVGASLAGLRAAQAARSAGWEGEITAAGEEIHMPYTRPPLSKEVLTGAAGEAVAEAHSLPADLDVTWLLGRRAVRLDRAARRVELGGGERLPYERLIVASGCRARRWSGPGADLDGVHTLRSVEDAVALRTALAGRPRLAIVGAGFIGCEVAASARKLGLEVTLLDVAATPMPALGPRLGRRWAEMHRSHGVDLRLGSRISGLLGTAGRVASVELVDGTRIEADVAVIALGAVPATEWLGGSGLSLDPGLRCDATLTALGDADVLAAGDVASWPYPLAGNDPIRVEHWTNAAEQGALAGRSACRPHSAREPHRGAPSFWSDQFGHRIQAVGLPQLADEMHLVEESDDDEGFVAIGQRGGVIVAGVALDAARRLPLCRRLLGAPFDRAALGAEFAPGSGIPQRQPIPSTTTRTK